jgi:(1->4)-alpha-D-glucan 1-alpha-D-glucosylmutase
MVTGDLVPDRNEEYLIYQTLLGTYPLEEMSDGELTEYRGRVQDHTLKVLREAEIHSGWLNPNISYEEGVKNFITALLEPSPSNAFITDFIKFNRLVANCGIYNSLSQTVLKIFSPGVPDIYQGNELWAFNLTDPDNRRPVDFTQRTDLLRRLKRQLAEKDNAPEIVRELMERRQDGRIKLYVTWKSLAYRRDNIALFDGGSYLPLRAVGTEKAHLCAFAWKKGKQELIVVVPRLVVGLIHDPAAAPLRAQVWGDTSLVLPKKIKGHGFRNIFTGMTVRVRDGTPGLLLAEVFREFPVAALESYIERT